VAGEGSNNPKRRGRDQGRSVPPHVIADQTTPLPQGGEGRASRRLMAFALCRSIISDCFYPRPSGDRARGARP
jgi:hypothetical protein